MVLGQYLCITEYDGLYYKSLVNYMRLVKKICADDNAVLYTSCLKANGDHCRRDSLVASRYRMVKEPNSTLGDISRLKEILMGCGPSEVEE